MHLQCNYNLTTIKTVFHFDIVFNHLFLHIQRKKMSVANTSFNLRLDKELKEQSFAVIERYGLTPTQAIKLFLKQVADRKILPLSFNYQAEEPNKETQQAMLMADKGLNDCYEVNSAEELTKVMEKIYNE